MKEQEFKTEKHRKEKNDGTNERELKTDQQEQQQQ